MDERDEPEELNILELLEKSVAWEAAANARNRLTLKAVRIETEIAFHKIYNRPVPAKLTFSLFGVRVSIAYSFLRHFLKTGKKLSPLSSETLDSQRASSVDASNEV